MCRSVCTIIAVASILTITSILAQAAEPVAHVSLQECIESALHNNIDVLTAKNGVISAQSRLTAAKSSYMPQVSVQNNTFTWSSSKFQSSVSNGTALTVSQNIYDGGLREAGVRKSYQETIQSSSGLTRTMQTILYSVSKAYYEVLRSRHLEKVAQANVKYNEGLREQILSRANVGDAAQTDVLPVEAQLATARVSLLSSQNSVRTTIIQLQSTIGLNSQAGFDVEEVNGVSNSVIEPMDTYIAMALESRPDIKQYRAITDAAKASTASSKLALYPRPTVTAQYQKQVTGETNTGGTQIWGGIVFDIFDGGSNRATYNQAETAQITAQIQEIQILKDIHLQVEEAYLNLCNARERMSASIVSLEASNKNYQVQQERYAQGLSTALDLLNAEVQTVTAQSDDVQARYDYYIALAQMDYAVGKQGGLL